MTHTQDRDRLLARKSLVRAEREGRTARGYIAQGLIREARQHIELQLEAIADSQAQLLGYANRDHMEFFLCAKR